MTEPGETKGARMVELLGVIEILEDEAKQMAKGYKDRIVAARQELHALRLEISSGQANLLDLIEFAEPDDDGVVA